MQLFLIVLAFAAFFAYALWSSRLGRPGGHLGHAAFCGAWVYPFLGTLLGPAVPAPLRISGKEAGTTIARLLSVLKHAPGGTHFRAPSRGRNSFPLVSPWGQN